MWWLHLLIRYANSRCANGVKTRCELFERLLRAVGSLPLYANVVVPKALCKSSVYFCANAPDVPYQVYLMDMQDRTVQRICPHYFEQFREWNYCSIERPDVWLRCINGRDVVTLEWHRPPGRGRVRGYILDLPTDIPRDLYRELRRMSLSELLLRQGDPRLPDLRVLWRA